MEALLSEPARLGGPFNMTATNATGFSTNVLRDHALTSGRRYWPRGEGVVMAVAAASHIRYLASETRNGVLVPLPDWAVDLGVGSPPSLLVDARAIVPGEGPIHDRCDWWLAAGLHLFGASERTNEARYGPAHSYAFRLRVDHRLFERAWANRIFLFLRRAAARASGISEVNIFGPLPSAEILLTHDVDAFTRRWELRLKQSIFHVANAGRLATRGKLAASANRLMAAARFAAGRSDLWMFDDLISDLERRGQHATFHFYAGPSGWRRRGASALLDPGYDIEEPRIAALVRRLIARGFAVGLHASVGTWRSSEKLEIERRRLESVTGRLVTRVRQHWLRFSWQDTWIAQSRASLAQDSTLGFNDRPGFRNGAALAIQPITPDGMQLPLTSVPMVLMDSHLYDYNPNPRHDRGAEIESWIREIRDVHGVASILWHPHTLHPAYGWREGFQLMLEILASR